MLIEIKHRFTEQVIVSGEYRNIKDCLEKNRGANLRGADLCGANLRSADLRSADLWGADLWGANLRGANLCGADLRGADLRCANLRGADLWSADLWGADLRSADLWGANLRGANLRGAKGYKSSYPIFSEIVRRQELAFFTKSEWAVIGQLVIHTPCWEEIKEKNGKTIDSILKKLVKLGWDEWQENVEQIEK